MFGNASVNVHISAVIIMSVGAVLSQVFDESRRCKMSVLSISDAVSQQFKYLPS